MQHRAAPQSVRPPISMVALIAVLHCLVLSSSHLQLRLQLLHPRCRMLQQGVGTRRPLRASSQREYG